MEPSRPRKLKPKQRIALIALENGENARMVAARAGVTVRTLYRWRGNPAFRQSLAAALDNFHENFPQEQAAARIFAFQALADTARWAAPADQVRAAAILLKYLDGPKAPPKSPKMSPAPTPQQLSPHPTDGLLTNH